MKPPFLGLAIFLTGMISGVALPAALAGAAPNPEIRYRNLFSEELGRSEGELDARLSAWWQQLFYGDNDTQRVYYPTADGMGYVADVANADARTEGLSYGMMIAVQLDHRPEFDRIWSFARRRLYHESGPYRGYFAWHAGFDGHPLSEGPAPDGEQWFAMALFFASHRWGEGDGIFNYGAEAQAILRTMLHKHEEADRGQVTDMFDARSHQVVFVPEGEGATFSDPSYLLPAFYELWARWASDPADREFFAEAATAARAAMRRAADPRTGLMPDYANFDGTPRARGRHGNFEYDAWRTLANPAVDWSWWHADPWEPEQADRVLGFVGQFGDACPDRFTTDGTALSKTVSSGLYSMAAVAGLAADPKTARPFVQRLWSMPIPEGRGRYYDGMLGFLAMLEAGGRFRVYDSPVLPAKTEPVAVFDWFQYSGDDTRFEAPLPAGAMRNPVLAGFYPDPSLCRQGDDYYLVNSSFTYFPGIPIFHSRDLAHWRQIGSVISRPTQVDFGGLGVSRGVFAPSLSFHDGTFYLVTTLVDCGGNCLFTAKDPSGPWSDPVFLDVDGIDPSLFWDEDGTAWLVNNGPPEGNPLYDGHRAIWLQRFDADRRRLVGPRTMIVNGGTNLAQRPNWIEGPHLFRREGWYYLICAEGGTAENHSEVVFRSRTLQGPWQAGPGNPILTQRDLPPGRTEPVTSTGHADFVFLPDGRTWAVFLGCRPYEGSFYNTGRETFALPVSWSDGWPLILRRGEAVPEMVTAPLADTASIGDDFFTGNFLWSDYFAGPGLAPQWNFLRTPRETWWSLSTVPGSLSLRPRAVTLESRGNPSFIGRRQQHARFSAAAELRTPSFGGFAAGIAAFQNESHHFFLGVRRKRAGSEVFLERASGGEGGADPIVVASAPLPVSEKIELRIEGQGRRYAFGFKTGDETWRNLAEDEDGSILSTASAGGFVGTYLGMYARLEAAPGGLRAQTSGAPPPPGPGAPAWAQPGSATHAQVAPPADFHRPSTSFDEPIGIFEGQTDVGSALVPGSASYDSGNGSYTIDSAGYNVWYTRDEFRYLWKKMSGDVSLAADINFPDPKGYGDRKAVLVIRQDLDDDSGEVLVALHGAGMIQLARRAEKGARIRDHEYRLGGRGLPGGATPDTLVTVSAKRIGIEKRGDQFALFVSVDGEPMHQFGAPISLHLEEPFYVGVGFCSHLPEKSDTAVLSGVVLENDAGKVR